MGLSAVYGCADKPREFSRKRPDAAEAKAFSGNPIPSRPIKVTPG